MRNKVILLIVVLGFLTGCGPTPPPKPKMNSLQVQAMQTEQFNASKRNTFNAVMTVLQNEGYVIQAASYDTGFITAQSATKEANPDFGDIFVGALIGGGGGTAQPEHISYNKSVSAFVTPVQTAKHKSAAKVRLSFVAHKTISGNGTRTEDQQILDSSVYKKAFVDIRQQLFVAPDM
jgi:hypothetical protein